MFKVPEHLFLWLILYINENAVGLGECSLNCTSCTNDTCVTCGLGTYLDSGSCHLCPEHCTSCYNFEVCNKCTKGYFGLSCAYNCPSWCVNNTCNKDSGVCTGGCIDGYFLSGLSCYPCSPNCKTCAISSNNCVQCKDENYGASCEYPCSQCKDGICSKENCTYGCGDGYYPANGACELCNIRCKSCSGSHDNCHTCIDGYFGKGCQFPCSDCITCNLEDGSCSGPTRTPPVTSTDSTAPFIASMTSVPRTMTQPPTSVSPQTNTSSEPSQILTSMESIHYQQNQPVDNTIIIYAGAGGGGGLAFLVLVVVVVVICKRRLSARGHETVAEYIDMTENENYISANDIDDTFRTSTDAKSEVTHVVYDENDAEYSLPNKTNRPSVETMETKSNERLSNIPPRMPVKSTLYSDVM